LRARRDTLSVELSSVKTFGRTEAQLSVSSARSILQDRNAKKRVITRGYFADRVLRTLPYALRPESKRAGGARKKGFALLRKIENKRAEYLHLLRLAPESKKATYQAMFVRAQRVLRRVQNRLYTLRTARVLGGARPVAHRAESPAARNFENATFHYLAARSQFTRNCMRLQAVRKRMTFDTSRPRL